LVSQWKWVHPSRTYKPTDDRFFTSTAALLLDQVQLVALHKYIDHLTTSKV
jgi:hypothetical protein